MLFASPSAVKAFISNFGTGILKNKTAVAIGIPTFVTLEEVKNSCNVIKANKSTVENMVFTLAANITL